MTTDFSNNAISRQRTFLNVALVYLLIFSSGSLRYNQSDNKYLVLGFLATVLAWIVYTDRKISSSFLLYFITFSGFLFSLSIYTEGSLSLASLISMLMKFLLAYLIIRIVGERFTDVFVNLVVFLATVSLLGYLSDTLQLFDGLVHKLPLIHGRGYDGFFYIFRDTFHPFRNQSLFFEPGAYQAFLNAALFIIFFFSPSMGRRKQLVYIVVLVAALITAYSTTGFLIFLCGFTLFLYKSEITTFYGKAVLIVAGLVIVSIFAAQFHSTFVKKINDYLTANEYDFSWSAQTRSSQLKADIRVIKKHVFGLGLERYKEEFRLEGRTDNQASSNGVSRMFAVYGVPFGIFIFGSFYWAFRILLNDPILTMGAFVMLLIFLGAESYYINAPLIYAIIAAAFVYSREYPSEELLGDAIDHQI